MEEKLGKNDANKIEQKVQKKSEKDKNGIIGGLVFGILLAFLAYQIYEKIFDFPIGQMLVYIIGFLAFICFMVSVSSFLDLKESKKLEKLEEEARREEKEFSEIDPEKRALRAEKMFRMNQKELMRYYDMNLAQTKFLSGLGIMMIIFGLLIVGVKSQVPAALVGKGPASASTVAWTMYQKYANGLPLYRQEKDWKQYGAQISRTTLANWIIYCSQNYFQPMYDYFHRELLKRNFAMADETRGQVLKEEGRRAQTQSFMWLFRSGEDGLPEIILYGYSPTRSGSHAREFLEGYSGYLETDGYQGYNNLPGIRRCSCWAHIRRYFIDAVPKGRQYDYSQPAVQGVQYCNRLFAIEDSINKKHSGDYEKRKQLRLEKEKPVLEAFWSWLDQQKPVRNTRMDKAVNYVLNRRDTAETYLEDGHCSFTNNLSENAIRPFAVGRKNWLFSSSVDGANASAVVYTMVEMAKAHGLNIYGYLKFLLEHRPSKDMTDEQLAELAPWSEKLQSVKNRM